MATLSAQLTELQAELVLVKSQMAAISARSQSFGTTDLQVTKVGYGQLVAQRTRLEKAIQRLLRGGRGMVVDLSNDGTDSASTDNTVYTQVTA